MLEGDEIKYNPTYRKHTFEYKGFIGSIEYSKGDKCFYGIILNIDDTFTFEGNNLDTLQKAFHYLVDAYIQWKTTDKEVENVRMPNM